MGKKYSQLSLEDRCRIACLQEKGFSLRKIAADLGRSPSTIAREVKRNSGNKVGYKPAHADKVALSRNWRGSRLERNEDLRNCVLGMLSRGLSPDQVAGRLKRESNRCVISDDSIYRFIYAQIARTKEYGWRLYLPTGRYKRGIRVPKAGSPASFIQHRQPLDKRPAAANDRKQAGHWEVDLMHFNKTRRNVLALHERKSRLLLACRPESKAAGPIADMMTEIFSEIPGEMRRTVSFDNGVEFSHHYRLNPMGTDTYFCNTHSPWQKGGVENAIGRMRRFLPSKTDLAKIPNRKFNDLIGAYNNTPRKCLDYQTPREVFLQQLLHFKCESTLPVALE